jgi:hypothetical protein
MDGPGSIWFIASRCDLWLPRGSSAASLLMSFQINLQEDAPWLA